MPWKGFLLHGLSICLQYGLIILMYYFLYRILRLMHADLAFLPIPRAKQNPAQLYVLDAAGGAPNQKVFLVKDRLSIGRSRDNDIMIDDTYVSHAHAVIEPEGGRYWLEDLNSINHTYLNGVILEKKTVLISGDIIKVGLVTFKFER